MKTKPFFAAFVEKQITAPDQIDGGEGPVTTLKSKDTITRPVLDTATGGGRDHVTMKYPSDGDEGVPM